MTTTAPSFARVLHALACGEEVSGAELLALPGFAEVETDWPLYPFIDYSLDHMPELVEHAGRLAVEVAPLTTFMAGYVAEDLRQHVEEFGVITEVIPQMRALLWHIGQHADLATRLPL